MSDQPQDQAPAPAPAAAVKTVKARVLSACHYGQPNDVAEVPADQVKAAEADGLIDTNKDAVKYAASLKVKAEEA